MKDAFESVISEELLKVIRNEFVLDWHGCHGISHWLRVRRNGLALCREIGGNVKLIEMFAMIHDCRRHDEGEDILHGKRATSFIERVSRMLAGILSSDEIHKLKSACEYHTTEVKSDDPNIRICWDADRLDIGRVGKDIDIRFLNTSPAKNETFRNQIFNQPIDTDLPSFFKQYMDF